jgi:hypothetical protein
MTDRWRGLFDDYRSAEAERLERERRRQELETSRREHDAWCQQAVREVMAAVAQAASRRADELALEAGVRVEVRPLRHGPGRPLKAEIAYLELVRGRDSIYLYAYREPGHAPLIHYLMPSYDGVVERAKHPRIVSFPGCRIARGDEGDPVLLQNPIDPSAGAEVVSIDDLIFRAFELLLRGGCMARAVRVDPELLAEPPAAAAPARA